MASQVIDRAGSKKAVKVIDKTSFETEGAELCKIQQNAFNNAPTNDIVNKTVSQLFEECVEQYGDRNAICFQSSSITYSELNAKANQLAHYLRKCGVGRNSLVAIYLERSIELIISILAVVKAGGVYIPLNKDDPGHRIRIILQDINPVKIITNNELHASLIRANALPHNSETNIIRINRFFVEKIEVDDRNPNNINTPEDPIYVMYTSGSTGKPKGCMIPHCGVVKLVKNPNIQINSTDNIAQIANAAFDAMTFEIWGALLHGASLRIIPQITLLSPVDLAQALRNNEISILLLTTSLLNLVAKNCPYAFDNVKYLLFGGEKANPEIVKQLLKRKIKFNLSRLNIINAYGPTEATTFSTTFTINNIDDIQKHVPIGKPIPNTTAYVFDENLQFVPEGVIGELYIGGKGVGLGYLNNPRQTALKFIDNPWKPGEKIFKTGDLVYWSRETGLVYMNRMDTQIKINGFRVEPGEIEACIVKNRAVKQAVVIVQDEREDRKELVAYVTFHQKEKVDFAKFHQCMKENIPYYMMPGKTILVDYIPLTASGKTDKIALSKMVGKNILESNMYNIPTSKIEKILIDVWQQLLCITPINVKQNLFDIGAHSLMLTEACALLNSKLNAYICKTINIMDILTYPTIQQLSNYINESKKNSTSDLENPIARASHQRKVLQARNAMHATR